LEIVVSQTRLKVVQGDITVQEVDAIVNAANSSLMGGGGVDGAIHRAGGPSILEECREIVNRQGALPPGEAVITGGGRLKARYVIHTVGPVWRGGKNNEQEILRRAYYNSLELAKEKGLRTVAFPSISTGAYGYPVADAASIALSTIVEYLEKACFNEVRMVLFNDEIFRIYRETLCRLQAART
jgi:O-acetyl-ADP-ribose deacetylase (regulator of RNase III)